MSEAGRGDARRQHNRPISVPQLSDCPLAYRPQEDSIALSAALAAQPESSRHRQATHDLSSQYPPWPRGSTVGACSVLPEPVTQALRCAAKVVMDGISMGLRTCYTPWGAYVRVHREGGRSESSPRDVEMAIRHDSGLPSAPAPSHSTATSPRYGTTLLLHIC
jgi:hypothetical protein